MEALAHCVFRYRFRRLRTSDGLCVVHLPVPASLIIGRVPELGDNPISLMLDSGVNNLTLFRETLGSGSNRQGFVDVGAFKSSGITMIETKTIRRLNLRRNELNDLTVIAVAGQHDQDVEGLVPIALFHSIFISDQEDLSS